MKNLFLFLFLILLSCAHYSTTGDQPESRNIINAPVDMVWDQTLRILPNERIDIKSADKATYSIKARKRMTLWSIGDDIAIRLIPHGSRTIMHFEAEAGGVQWIGWGHQERMVKSIFAKIKLACER